MRYTIIIVSFFLIIISINIYDYFFKSVFEGSSKRDIRRQRNGYKRERDTCKGQLQDATRTIQSQKNQKKSLSKRNIEISSSLNNITNQYNSLKIQLSKIDNEMERITNDKIDIEDQLLKCKEMNNQNVASGRTQ